MPIAYPASFRTKPYILSRLADRSFICGLVRKDEPCTDRAYRTCGLVRKDEPDTGHGVRTSGLVRKDEPPYGARRTAPVALCGKTNPARLTARKEPGARIGADRHGTRDVGPGGLGRNTMPWGGRLGKA